MTSLPPPTPSALLLSPQFTPILHTYTTPDLHPILSRSKFHHITHLLSAFQASVDKVTVRSVQYDQRLLPKFGVRFVERELPPSFAGGESGTAGGGVRARSGTLGSLNAGLGGGGGVRPSPATPTTPSHHPSQAERDDLFLDSLSSSIADKVDGWISQTGREELDVRGARPRRRWPEDGDEAEVDPAGQEQEQEQDEGWQGRSVESLTPWYAAMRDEVFRRREMVEWETFAWPVGCLLCLSTSHPDPLNALASLWDLTSPTNLFSSSSPSSNQADYASPNILRSILLIHDLSAGTGQEGWEDAQELHETIRKTYGLHTALVPLFGAAEGAKKRLPRARGVAGLWPVESAVRPPTRVPVIGLGVTQNDEEEERESVQEVAAPLPLPARETGHDLSDEDLKSLRVFMRELVVQSVVPWIERQVVVGHEQYTASKRSIGGRLFSAGRKYFGGSTSGNSRAGSPVSATGAPLGYNAVKGYYPHTAQESQTRRLADLAFMLGDYKLSASIYDSVSKDYKTDRAWRYYASAVRMTGLSLLLSHPHSTPLPFNPDTYLEAASATPLAQSGVVDLDGLRGMMRYYEVYRAMGEWRVAPMGLVRTAGEMDEVSSALLLEQAAIADLNLPRCSRRKYAFHMAMAAARYEKSGLKPLSRRCLSQAATLYRLPSPSPSSSSSPSSDPPAQLGQWSAIRTHLHHGLGRQAYNVGRAEEAVGHFLQLLEGQSAAGGEAEGAGAGGEGDWVDDFRLAWEHLDPSAHPQGLQLPVHIFTPHSARIRVQQRGNVSRKQGEGVEWRALEALGGVRGAGKKEEREGEGEEVVVLGETFYLDLCAVNPLDAPLFIGGLQVGVETDAPAGAVEIDAPVQVELGPRETRRISIPIRPTTLHPLLFTHLTFTFANLLPCTEPLTIAPKRLTSTRAQLASATYSTNTELRVSVREAVGVLSVGVEELPSEMWAGEGRRGWLVLGNVGGVGVSQLRGVCGAPEVALFDSADVEGGGEGLYGVASGKEEVGGKSTVPNRLLRNGPTSIPLPGGVLQPGQSIRVSLMLRGDSVGSHTLRWLFTFHGADEKDDAELLTARAVHQLDVRPSLDVRPFVRPSNSPATPYVLGLEIHNSSIPTDVTITQITSLSPRWKCSLLPGFDFSSDVTPLGWQQSLNVLLAVQPVEDEEGVRMAEEGAEFAVRKLDELLQGKEVTGSEPGEVVLHRSGAGAGNLIDLSRPNSTLFSSILRTHTTMRHLSLSTQLPTIPPRLHSHLFPSFSPRSLDLLIFWSTSNGVEGHHHLTDVPLGAGDNRLKAVLEMAELKAGGLYAESQRERALLLGGLRRCELGVDEAPAKVVVRVEEVVDHDFASGPCTLPVTFTIRNLSPSLPFTFTLTLQDLTQPASPNIVYSGALTHRGTAAPLSLTTISTQLWITRQGAYDLGGWSLSTTREGAQWVEQGRPLEVRVRDTSRSTGGALAPSAADRGANLVNVSA